ncbi:Bifunctional phosphatase chloroplastic [Micractinium conductrix]|uniref:histidinol-phosphatase n=1 Tax=Micractinium conductrix TaxID=554055 RepID=A0A2P6VGH0_9CHLO|nr:Bifunctional phosphatase chloroplastic [Micractinium conductrix]|eukprot:PSC73171.1 Bifunctional phosphatase chloroplastic [Micractinium conductrix]
MRVVAPSPARACCAPSPRHVAAQPSSRCAVRGMKARRSAAAAAAAAGPAAAAVPQEYVELAHCLADEAGRVSARYFRTPVPVDVKSDASPVTQADREAEAAVRALLSVKAPDHAIFGEEQGYLAGGAGSEWLWVVDPIDGTKSFITGKPLFGTLIALLHKGTPVLGIIDQPILRERWLGVAGAPSTLNGRPIATRQCASIGNAYLYATTPHMFSGATETAFNRVRDAVRIPMYGCDCYAYGLLAAGYADLVVEADLKPYDYMALVPIIKGAGGVITDWRGEPLRWAVDSQGDVSACSGEVVAAGDARSHAQAVQLLQWK